MNYYNYNQSDEIPSLMLDVRISKFQSKTAFSHIAKIDTAADITRVPEKLKNKLNLSPIGERSIVYGNNTCENVNTYLAVIGWDAHKISAEIYFRESRYILIGRNVLNHMVMHCNGIDMRFWFEDPI